MIVSPFTVWDMVSEKMILAVELPKSRLSKRNCVLMPPVTLMVPTPDTVKSPVPTLLMPMVAPVKGA